MDLNYFTFKPLDNGKYKLAAPRNRNGSNVLNMIACQISDATGKNILVENVKGTDYVCIILDDEDMNLVFHHIAGRD